MNRERLQAIVDVLETVPPNEFSIEDWDCGTTACAIGWAIRRNAMLGWSTRKGGFNGNKLIPIPPKAFDNSERDIFLSLAHWFGTTRNTTVSLFCPDMYSAEKSSPQEVIDRIKKVLEIGS